MKNPQLAYEITKAVAEAVPVPVTVKIRKGWDNDGINAVQMAALAEKAGAAVKLVLPEEKNVTVEFDVPNLQETLTAINEKASLSIDAEQFVLVGQLSGTVSGAGQEELSVPEDCISQDTVEILEGVRVLIQELLAK